MRTQDWQSELRRDFIKIGCVMFVSLAVLSLFSERRLCYNLGSAFKANSQWSIADGCMWPSDDGPVPVGRPWND